MGTVYIVQESPGKNVLGATSFGNPEFLLPSDRQVTFSPGPTVFELRNRLQRFCDDDYILLIGDPAAIGIACMVAGEANLGRVKLLKWDRQEQRYYPIQVDLHPEIDKGRRP